MIRLGAFSQLGAGCGRGWNVDRAIEWLEGENGQLQGRFQP